MNNLLPAVRFLFRWLQWTSLFAALLVLAYLFDGLTPGVAAKQPLSKALYAMEAAVEAVSGIPHHQHTAGFVVIIGGAILLGLIVSLAGTLLRSLGK